MAKIDKAKLPALHAYFEDGGSTEEEDIAAFLGIKPTAENLKAWKAAYDDYRNPPEDEEPVIPAVKFREPSGILRDLEVIKVKDGTIYVREPVVRDLVTIMLKGTSVTVDCEELRKLSPTTVVPAHGRTAKDLLALAELAR